MKHIHVHSHESGVTPRLIQFLQCHNMPRLQYEALWIMGNIVKSSTENVTIVINSGILPILVQLLSSQWTHTIRQSILAVGHISGSCQIHCNLVLSHDILSKLLPFFNKNTYIQQPLLFLDATWTLSQLCRGIPQTDVKYASLALQILCRIIKCDDDKVLQNICWAYSYLTNMQQNEEIFYMIRTSGALQILIDLINHQSPHLRFPVLRTIGNILNGSYDRVKGVIDVEQVNELKNKVIRENLLHQLPRFVQGCYTSHPATQFECTQRIRKLLAIEKEPPITAVIQSGIKFTCYVFAIIDFARIFYIESKALSLD